MHTYQFGMKYIKFFSFAGIICLLYSSCAKKENYSDIPSITYNSFNPFCSASTTDSAYLRINFTDGDGDIGYPDQDANAPYNCFIIAKVDSADKFVSEYVNGTVDTFSYHIPDITPSGNDKELNGIIQINLEGFVQSLVLPAPIPGMDFHKIQFTVWIYDRAGHKSNVLITPTVYSCGN